MLRILLVTVLILTAAAPALAGPQERANALFVEAVKLIQAGNQEQEPDKRLEQLERAQSNLHRIVNDYPSSDLAVQLISGQRIGVISLQFIRLAVEGAEREALEQRATRAATAVEDLMLRLSETKTVAEGEPLAVLIERDIDQLWNAYGSTDYLENLRARFERQRTRARDVWSATAAKPVEERISQLEPSKTVEELETLATSIKADIKQLSSEYGSTDYLYIVRARFELQLSRSLVVLTKSIEEIFVTLEASKTSEGGEPLVELIENNLEQLAGKFGWIDLLQEMRVRLKQQHSRSSWTWSETAAKRIEQQISKLAASKSAEEGEAIAAPIRKSLEQHTAKYGSNAHNQALRNDFSRQLAIPLNIWAKAAAKPVEELLIRLGASKVAEEGEPLARSIESDLERLSGKYGSTEYLQDLRVRFREKLSRSSWTWSATAAKPIEKLISQLAASKTPEEGEPFIASIEKGLKQHVAKYGSNMHNQVRRHEFTLQLTRSRKIWAKAAP